VKSASQRGLALPKIKSTTPPRTHQVKSRQHPHSAWTLASRNFYCSVS
jgi:hypothetical protein